MTIFESPFGPLALRDVSTTECLFEGLAGDPDRVVLVDGPTGRTVTAAELEDQIRRLAGGLTAQDLGPGRTVALMAPNIPEFCSVFHGVAFAGGTVTTINPTYTEHEIRHQLQDAGADILITIPAFAEMARSALTGTLTQEVYVIGDAEGVPSWTELMGPPQAAQAPVDLDRHVVVLPYSSGTTGLPKGVMLSHRNLVANVDQSGAAIDVTDGEMTVAFLPFFHIYGMTVLMNLFLSNGGGLVTMPRFDLPQFLQLAQDYRVRQLYIVPPVALALAKHPLVDQFDLSSVEILFSGAAPLGGDVEAAVTERLGAQAMQGYGMTEMSPVSHASRIDAYRTGTAGKTVPGTQCRIVDPDSGRDLGVGEEGELWVRGPQVMLGYLNNPEATSEALDSDGWLRTGDLAVFDEDGFMSLRERLKELIKVKGFQVAPAELEATLLSHPRIVDAAVIGRPDPEAGEVPVGFVVKAPDADLSAEDVQAHVAEYLAHYKHLADVHFVEAVPKSASGKILRRVLRDEMASGAG